MINRILLSIVLVFLFFPLIEIKAQNDIFIAYYGKRFHDPEIDNIEKSTLKSDMQFIEQGMNQEMKTISYKLRVSKNESLFEVIESIEQKDESFQEMAVKIEDGGGMIYINSLTKEKIIQKENYGQLFLISGSSDDIKWELTNETKVIGSVKCFKATAIKTIKNSRGTINKTVVAWYTIDLPYSFGPAGYGNLPGFIVELNIGSTCYFLQKIDAHPKEKKSISKPVKGKKIAESEYNSISDKNADDFFKGMF